MFGELVLLSYLVGFGIGALEAKRRIREHRTAYDNPELRRTNFGWVRAQ